MDPALFLEGRTALRGAECLRCGLQTFPAAPGCPSCGAVDVRDTALPDSGRLWTFTVLHAAAPGYVGPVPYALGVVELSDGARITATILSENLAGLEIGATVRLELTEVGPTEERRTTFAFRTTEEEDR
ncbi:Zn-ribbon domain-containing OB-fold protein [Pseudonocardia sp. KRD291]|uniref:Zn-ribbon domain-containing OB-fold protein n=1 Tax=Pseudonocardia sp. KRD291 TaxID=2792007 RepID=UPI001C4A69D8|nr:OB-fold domain-containing protein [Pseudonocardia sp. KRD291]MBW0101022.1 OB-fold domain-containing protein [Pseudonocardia sp. KRD291]